MTDFVLIYVFFISSILISNRWILYRKFYGIQNVRSMLTLVRKQFIISSNESLCSSMLFLFTTKFLRPSTNDRWPVTFSCFSFLWLLIKITYDFFTAHQNYLRLLIKITYFFTVTNTSPNVIALSRSGLQGS